MTEDFPQPERVLLIVAHPDDPEFGAAGTVARWTQAGTEVTYIIVSDGSKGTADPDMTGEELAHIRQREQFAAAEVVGVKNVTFLGFPDGHIFNNLELRRELVRQIRLHRPELVVTHDPTTYIINNTRINHSDHRKVGETVLDAIFPLARDRLNFPEHEKEGLESHKVLDIFLLFTDQPNCWVNISNTIDKKMAALAAHDSQVGAHFQKLEERIRERCRKAADDQNYEYAEIFRRITLPY
jgi:LmbE family N-acetylglucosaminyl deacetylase